MDGKDLTPLRVVLLVQLQDPEHSVTHLAIPGRSPRLRLSRRHMPRQTFPRRSKALRQEPLEEMNLWPATLLPIAVAAELNDQAASTLSLLCRPLQRNQLLLNRLSTPFTPEFERTSRGYFQTGKGERTFVSSTPLGRSESVRTPSGSYHTSARQPSTPTSGRSGRHRSASPKPTTTPNNYDSTSASESEDDAEDSEYVPRSNGPKPKAVPKSRLRAHQKLADMYHQERPGPGTGEDPFSFIIQRSLAFDEDEIRAARMLAIRRSTSMDIDMLTGLPQRTHLG